MEFRAKVVRVFGFRGTGREKDLVVMPGIHIALKVAIS